MWTILTVLAFIFGGTTSFHLERNRGTFIVGGTDIDITEAPFVALMFFSPLGDGHYLKFCGSIIINRSFLLTAAHCTCGRNPKQFQIMAGATKSTAHVDRFSVKNIYEHPKYKRHPRPDYDISVLELEKSLVYSDRVKPIPLAKVAPTGGEDLTTYGWGAISTTGPSSENLKKVTVKVVDMKTCNKTYNFELTSRMICATLPDKDSCFGDSGGPAVVDGVVAGIVSFGCEGCAHPVYPGVYTSVADPGISDYIKKIISKGGQSEIGQVERDEPSVDPFAI